MRLLRRKAAGQRGFAMVETLLALVVAATAMTVGFSAISTGAITVVKTQSLNQAQSVASAQVEYVKSLAFVNGASTYATGVTVPSGLTLSTTVTTLAGADTNAQQVTVTVTRGGV